MALFPLVAIPALWAVRPIAGFVHDKIVGEGGSEAFYVKDKDEAQARKGYSRKIPLLNRGMFNSHLANQYEKTKGQDLRVFSEIKNAEGKKPFANLMENQAEKEYREALSNWLFGHNKKNAKEMKEEFQQHMEAFYQIIEDRSTTQTEAEYVLDELVHKPLLEKIEARQVIEKETLEKYHNDAELMNELCEKLNITNTPENQEKLKADMRAALQEKHSADLKAMREGMQKNKTLLSDACARQTENMLVMNRLTRDNSNMRKAFLDSIAIKKKNMLDEYARMHNVSNIISDAGYLEYQRRLEADMPTEGVSITGNLNHLSVDELATWETITGRTVERGEDGSLTIQFSSRAWEFFRSLPQDFKADKADFRSLVEAIPKHMNGVEININFDDEKMIKQKAGAALEAALEAGISPAKIKLKINGKDHGPDFSEFISDAKFKKAQQLGEVHRQKVEALKKLAAPAPVDENSQERMKNTFNNLKQLEERRQKKAVSQGHRKPTTP